MLETEDSGEARAGSIRKSYAKPRLATFGPLKVVTASGTVGGTENHGDHPITKHP